MQLKSFSRLPSTLWTERLWLLLKGVGVPERLINIFKNLYTDTICRVRAEGGASNPFMTSSGVRQGCVAAPNLFNTAIDYCIDHVIASSPDLGVHYRDCITDLDFADDVS